jgi:predicted PurR-regulated permease PerM
MQSPAGFSSASRFFIVSASIVLLVAGMKAATELLVPFLLALFVAVIAAPPLFMLRQRGLPGWLAMLLVIALIIGIGAVLAWLVGGAVNDFSSNLPKYQASLAQQTSGFSAWLTAQGVQVDPATFSTYLDPGKAMGMAAKLLSALGGVLTQAVFILITVIFILVEAAGFREKLRSVLQRPESALEHIDTITDNIKRYMMIKTTTSLLTGALVSLWLMFLGVDYPMLWGTVAFLFNYVPNIGSIIAAVPAVLLALVQLGPMDALWVMLGYLLINNLVGNVIEPRFMGKGLGLSPLVVFVSLVFWGWVLGPVGMFLSVPLTMVLKIVLASRLETQLAAELLGS